MPNLDVLGVLERLNTMPHIIILSAISEDKIIKRALELGADRYIVKPFDLDFLVKIIRKIFENYAISA